MSPERTVGRQYFAFWEVVRRIPCLSENTIARNELFVKFIFIIKIIVIRNAFA